MKTTNYKDKSHRDLSRLFNMNNVLSHVIAFGAYFVVIGAILILTYLSFVETFKFTFDWKTIGIFSGATVLLSWTCWNTFYHKQYEKLMDEDIRQQAEGGYSIHARYYNASKDWKDVDLQKCIDEFNEEYTRKWLNWVEKTTGVPIKSCKQKIINPDTNEEEIVDVVGIEDLPYKGFKYKKLMYRIKNHKYPQSGYKTSMELTSLFSYQDANLNKRNLRADKTFYTRKTLTKLFMGILTIVTGASLIPEMISGEYWSAILKLAVAIGSLMSGVFMGAMNGVKGARLKLSVVEDACYDLERWAEKKPIIEPYIQTQPEEVVSQTVEEEPKKESKEFEVTKDIFSQLNIQK